MVRSIIDDLMEKQPDLDRDRTIFRDCPFSHGYNHGYVNPLCEEDNDERSTMEICGECWNSPVKDHGPEGS